MLRLKECRYAYNMYLLLNLFYGFIFPLLLLATIKRINELPQQNIPVKLVIKVDINKKRNRFFLIPNGIIIILWETNNA